MANGAEPGVGARTCPAFQPDTQAQKVTGDGFDLVRAPPRDVLAHAVCAGKLITPGAGGTDRNEQHIIAVNDLSEFTAEHRQTVRDGLKAASHGRTYVLIGERHNIGKHEKFREEIADALVVLRQEGFTHLAVELNRDLQTLLDSLEPGDVHLRDKIRKVRPLLWQEGNTEIVARGIELGMRVLCPDLGSAARDSKVEDTASFQNFRDASITAYLRQQVPSNGRVVVFYGDDHIHKAACRSYADGEVDRFGARLAAEIGSDRVASIRFLACEDPLDGSLSYMANCPRVNEVAADSGVFLLPDRGPAAGDKSITAADYIVIDSNKY